MKTYEQILADAERDAVAAQREVHKRIARAAAPAMPIGLIRLDGEIVNPPAPSQTAAGAHASHKTTCSSCGGELPPCPHCAAQGKAPSMTALPPSGGSGADVGRGDGGDEGRTLAEVRADNARWAASNAVGGGFAVRVSR